MPGKSQSHTDAVLNVLRGSALSAITPWVGLLSVAPANDNSAGTELVANGYVRQVVTFGAPTTDTGNIRQIANTGLVSFGPATADWDEAVAFAVYGAETGDSIRYWDALPTPKTVLEDDYAQFAIGALKVKED